MERKNWLYSRISKLVLYSRKNNYFLKKVHSLDLRNYLHENSPDLKEDCTYDLFAISVIF